MRLLTLKEAARLGAEEVGGKALGLARLAALGVPVPDAMVLPAAAHERWARMRRLSQEEARELWRAASELGQPLAVRSSAADEDGARRSAAGQYESVMDVREAAALKAAIERCYSAAAGERAVAYRSAPGPSRVALVLQREVVADRAGVAFSADPTRSSGASVVIEAVFGHGEGVVSGELAPDRYLVDRESKTVHARIADKQAMADGRGHLVALPAERRLSRVLRDHEARELAELVLKIEASFGAPVDVEFCYAGRRLWLLQARPITTLHGLT